MKKLISLALAGGMVLSLAACGSSASTAASTATESTSTAESTAESTASEGKQLKIAFFMYENSNTFTTYIRKGLENYGAENNVVVDSFDGKSDQSTQTDAITTTLAKGGYDLIVVNPVDSGAGETINNLCRQYNIPVIYADRAPDLVGGILDDYEQAYYVGLDWSDPGAVQAQMVYDAWTADSSKLDKNGDGVLQYVLLQGNVAQQNAIYRTAAINELFEGWAADGTMKTEQLDIQDGNWSSDKGKDVTAGAKAGGAMQRKVRVHIQKQQAVLLQHKAVDRLKADALVRNSKVGDAAGQLAGIQPDSAGVLRQNKGDRHLMGQLVVGVLGCDQAFPGRKAAAGVVEQLRQGEGKVIRLRAVLGKLGLADQQLLLQLQTPLCQLGNTLVREPELLLQLCNMRLQGSRGRGEFMVHNGILLFLIL